MHRFFLGLLGILILTPIVGRFDEIIDLLSGPFWLWTGSPPRPVRAVMSLMFLFGGIRAILDAVGMTPIRPASWAAIRRSPCRFLFALTGFLPAMVCLSWLWLAIDALIGPSWPWDRAGAYMLLPVSIIGLLIALNGRFGLIDYDTPSAPGLGQGTPEPEADTE